MNRTRNHTRRGSVLMAVVGLLTIIALLGSSFLVVSRLDAQRAEAIAEKTPADPLVGSLVGRIRQQLADDLAIEPAAGAGNQDRLFHGPSPDAGAPARYVDYPDGRIDPWLSSGFKPSQPGTWDYLGKLPNTGSAAGSLDPNGIDTDGDGRRDAMLYASGIYSEDGSEQYYYAIRIEDTSAFINVNTAYEPIDPAILSPIHPVNVNLAGFMPYPQYAMWLHTRRALAAPSPQNLTDYTLACGTRLSDPNRLGTVANPMTPYHPFAIDQEPLLRTVDPLHDLDPAQNPMYYTHRLMSPLWPSGYDPVPPDTRRLLTTCSITRSLVRRYDADPNAIGGDPRRILLVDPNSYLAPSHIDPNASQIAWDPNARRSLADTLSDLGLTDQEVAHYVANLWAYCSDEPISNSNDTITNPDNLDPNAFKFSYGSSTDVYGVVEQLVVSEVFVYHLPRVDPNSGNDGWACAIELLNPTVHTVSLNGYKIADDFDGEDTDPDIKLSDNHEMNLVRPGERIVLYAYGGQFSDELGGANRGSATVSDFFSNVNAQWIELTGDGEDLLRDFAKQDEQRICITRRVVLAGGSFEAIPVDIVTDVDTGYDAYSPVDAGNPAAYTFQRDDDLSRGRAAVAIYEGSTWSVGSSIPDHHDLGNANTKVPAGEQIDGLDVYEGFWIRRLKNNRPPRSQGDLLNIYLTGPRTDGPLDTRALTSRLGGRRDQLDRGRAEFWTNPLSSNPNYGRLPWSALLAEMVEVVPPDPTRPDQPRIYGRVNINTAPVEVIRQLIPETVFYYAGQRSGTGDTTAEQLSQWVLTAADRDELAAWIVAYREMTSAPGGSDYANRGGATGITDLRNDGEKGFLTPGEVAIPMLDWFRARNGQDPAQVRLAEYIGRRNGLVQAVLPLVDVRSDTFAAYIYVQLGPDPEAASYKKRYLAVFDRSHVRRAGQLPAVLMMTPLE